jgi:hypothetical protein
MRGVFPPTFIGAGARSLGAPTLVEIAMIRILVVVASAMLLVSGPVLAGTYAAAPATEQAAKPKPSTSVSDGRTLSDYNIQKE